MELGSFLGFTYGSEVGYRGISSGFNLTKEAVSTASSKLQSFSPKYAKLVEGYKFSPYRPSTLFSRATSRFKSPKEYFSPEVVSSKENMSLLESSKGPKGMISEFEKARTPDGILITHGTKQRTATPKLRQRVTAVITKGDDVLLMSHSKGLTKTYMLPGGAQEAGELAKASLAREVAEELGLKVSKTQFLGNVADYSSGNLYKVYKVTVKGTPKLAGETTAFKWVNMKTLQQSNLDDFIGAYNKIKSNPNIKHVAIDLDRTLMKRIFKKGKYISSDLRPGSREFLKQLKSEGYKITIWSHGEKAGVVKALKDTKLSPYIDDVITREQYAVGLGHSTIKDIRKIGADIIIDDNPKVFLSQTTGYQITPYFGKEGKYAWHVNEIMKRYISKNWKGAYPFKPSKIGYKDFVTEGGPRSTGMEWTPKGELGSWPFATKKATSTKYTWKGKQYKPAIIESSVKEMKRPPLKARSSPESYQSFMKYSHKAEPDVIYTTMKTEFNWQQKPGWLEVEGETAPGILYKKTPEGFNITPTPTISDKWYKLWGKIKGYEDFTIVPKYYTKVPIRPYKTAGLADDYFNLTGKETKSIPKGYATERTLTGQSKALSDYIETGIEYKPVLSPSFIGKKIATRSLSTYKSYQSRSYKRPSYYRHYYTPKPYEKPYRYQSYYYPTKKGPTVKPSNYKPLLLSPGSELKEKQQYGYNVFVRESDNKDAKFRQASGYPLKTKEQAYGLGASIVDNTISRSFKVRKTNEKPVDNPTYSAQWTKIKHKFCPPAENKKIVEKKKYRNDTYGEKMKFKPFKPNVVKL